MEQIQTATEEGEADDDYNDEICEYCYNNRRLEEEKKNESSALLPKTRRLSLPVTTSPKADVLENRRKSHWMQLDVQQLMDDTR